MKILNKNWRSRNLSFLPIPSLMIIAMFMVIVLDGCGTGDQSTISDPTKFSSVETVKCTADSTQQYEVYTPTTFDGKGTLPVIFLFDAHADGKLSIEKFKFGAEKFGYMLAASDNSKNGVSNIEYIIQALFTDVLQKYPVDQKRIYAGGFSGGARVALSAAVEMKNIKGIFIAGAGLSGMDVKQVSPKFDIYATAGYSDFNYNEVAIIPEELKNTDWRWIMSNFEGTHGWPPQQITTEAVEWFTFNAMKDGLVPKNNGLIKQYSSLFMSRIDSLQQNGRYLDASKECTKAAAFLDKLT